MSSFLPLATICVYEAFWTFYSEVWCPPSSPQKPLEWVPLDRSLGPQSQNHPHCTVGHDGRSKLRRELGDSNNTRAHGIGLLSLRLKKLRHLFWLQDVFRHFLDFENRWIISVETATVFCLCHICNRDGFPGWKIMQICKLQQIVSDSVSLEVVIK